MPEFNLEFDTTLGRTENRVFYDIMKGDEVADEVTSVCFADVKSEMMGRAGEFTNDKVTAVKYYPWLMDTQTDLQAWAEQWLQFAMSIPFVKSRVLEYTGYTLHGHDQMGRDEIDSDKYVLIDFSTPVDEAFVTAQLFRMPQESPGNIQLFARLLEEGCTEAEAWIASLYCRDFCTSITLDGHSCVNGYDPVWWQKFMQDPSIAVSKGNRFKSDVLGGSSINEYPGLPVSKLIEQLRDQDLPKHYVVVYGSLRHGMGNHGLLKEGMKSGDVVDMGRYVIPLPAVMYDTGYGFPALVPSVEKHNTVLEQYKVNDTYLRKLDQLEGYPDLYNRAQVMVQNELSWVYYQPEAAAGYKKVTGDWARYAKGVA